MSDFNSMSRDELIAHLVSAMEDASKEHAQVFPRMHKRPMLGGEFGAAGFLLCSYCFTSKRLQEVRYYVFSEHGLFLGAGETKGAAISMAREFLSILQPQARAALLAKYRAHAEERERELLRRENESRAEAARHQPKVRSIGRRRQRIFDESGGKCHYCETPLSLDGKWHIEHKMPRALGGGNEPNNLVASCVTCNMKKRDTTDVEFKARMNKESAQ